MSSTFKNRIPKRKYRERAQPEARAHLGTLEKRKDYKARAQNYHRKEDMINQLKQKAGLKNEDEFYFQMAKGKRNQEGKFVQEDSDDDSDFDEKDYRASLKTENYGIVLHQRSIVQGVCHPPCRKSTN
jgi:U3 small nucleolar RNA-associated protein 11